MNASPMNAKPMNAKNGNKGRPLTGKKVLVWFLGFFFVILGANLTMSWFAVTTFSGIETEDAYAKGRDFNDEIARVEEQRNLGWTITVASRSLSKDETFLSLTITDKHGVPLEALDVTGLLVRRVQKGVDQALTFAPTGKGTWVAAAKLPLSGQWQLRALVKDAGGHERKIVHDIMVGS